MSRFYPVLVKIQINLGFLERKTLEIIRTTRFIWFWQRSRFTKVYCTSKSHIEMLFSYHFVTP